MASQAKVKAYLAYWFQLGKRVVLESGRILSPKLVIEGDRYSQEFEQCWQTILSCHKGDCYLEGTEQTIQQLLSPAWDLDSCARCGLLIPLIELGIQSPTCPCCDLDNWPNSELPAPHLPVDSSTYLNQIKERLDILTNCDKFRNN